MASPADKGRTGAQWVFQSVIQRPPLVVWAAFSDLDRRMRCYNTVMQDRQVSAVLTGPRRQLEVDATWNVTTRAGYVDDDGNNHSHTYSMVYTVTESVPGKSVVFYYEHPNNSFGVVGPRRMAAYFNELPNGDTEVIEEINDPSNGPFTSPTFWCMTVTFCGAPMLFLHGQLDQLRQRQNAALLAFKAHIETLDAATWMAGVQADLVALKMMDAGSSSSSALPPSSQQPHASPAIGPL